MTLLEKSPNLRLRDKETMEFQRLGKLAGSAYDNLLADNPVMRDAKCGMLNTCAKLAAVRMPCGAGMSWAEGIEQALHIQRDRIVGIASPGLRHWVRGLHANAPSRFNPNYKRAGADIDENGNLLKHFGDWIGHQSNGGTHPYHVYDLLHRALAEPLMGYRLV